MVTLAYAIYCLRYDVDESAGYVFAAVAMDTALTLALIERMFPS